MMKLQTIAFQKLALRLLLAAALIFSFLAVTAPSQVDALSTKDCSLKVNKETCEAEVKDECSTNPDARDRCIVSKAKKYATVFTVCRDKAEPQECHKQLREKCKGKTGKAREDCKKRLAKEFAKATASGANTFQFGATPKANSVCGEDNPDTEQVESVNTRFDFGCQGEGGPIEDLAYAIIRFLSVGVGLVIIASIIYAGIQYSSSEGNSEAAQASKKRIQNAIVGLIFYLFIFALVQYLVPGGLFN